MHNNKLKKHFEKIIFWKMRKDLVQLKGQRQQGKVWANTFQRQLRVWDDSAVQPSSSAFKCFFCTIFVDLLFR